MMTRSLPVASAVCASALAPHDHGMAHSRQMVGQGLIAGRQGIGVADEQDGLRPTGCWGGRRSRRYGRERVRRRRSRHYGRERVRRRRSRHYGVNVCVGVAVGDYGRERVRRRRRSATTA